MLILLSASFSDEERETWLGLLRGLLPNDEIVPELPASRREEVIAAIVANPPHGSLQNLPNLKLIQSLWAGVDRLLTDATLPQGVPICRMVDPSMNVAMAETSVWATLSLHRYYFEYMMQQRDLQWKVLPQRRSDEMRVLVLGAGQMGLSAAHRIHKNGYRVSVWASRQRTAAELRDHCIELEGLALFHGPEALASVLITTDILINLLPLTPQTRGIINRDLLYKLPRGSSIVNLARGGHVVDDDLLEAVSTGQIRHTVLDVYHQEPLPESHPFWRHKQVTILPHAAALTDPRSAAAIAVRNVYALKTGERFESLVDRSKGY